MHVHIYLSTHICWTTNNGKGKKKEANGNQDQVTHQFVPIMEVRLAILGLEIPSFWDDFPLDTNM
jgi:hypothetical protein